MVAPTTLDALVDLIQRSGLIEESRQEAFLQQVKEAQTDMAVLVVRLVEEKLLTSFQAGQLLQGKWRGFYLGKYKLLEPLGVGGMARVFLCEHTVMRRRVAVKVLPNVGATEASVKRFYREARASGAMDHPNFVRAYDIDREGKWLYLVLEYIDGLTLGELVRRDGPLKIDLAVEYIRQAALGLQHAHDLGWVHRDVKPDNLLLTREGTVKILDLGLARLFEDNQDLLTQQYDEKAILGTADYLAPEQVSQGATVDGRADVYGLGATFYHLLTGVPLFPRGSVAEKLMWSLVQDPRPIRSVRPEVPESLATIIERMLDKDPRKRQQTPLAVADVLVEWSENQSPPAGQFLPDKPAALPAPSKPRKSESAPRSASIQKKRRPDKPPRAHSRSRVVLAVALAVSLVGGAGALWFGVHYLLPVARTVVLPRPSLANSAQTPLAPGEAAKHVGENVLVEMEVQSSGVSRNGLTYFLNSQRDYQSPENFTIVIHKAGMGEFLKNNPEDPVAPFRTKVVRIRGTVQLFRGAPQIVVTEPDQIRILASR